MFDASYWVVGSQPWFGWPSGFHDEEGDSDTCVIDDRIHEMLWRPGSISRWAEYFSEEYVSLWVPAGDDPIPTVQQYEKVELGRSGEFVDEYSSISLQYTASCCWEIFAVERSILDTVTFHVARQSDVKCYSTTSQNRRRGFSQIGWKTWPR